MRIRRHAAHDHGADPDASVRAAPALITDDPDLRTEIERLGAGSGVRVAVSDPGPDALARWSDTPVVLIGADSASAIAALRPPRRSDVHVITLGAPGIAVYRDAVTLGASEVVTLPEATAWVVDLLSTHGETARDGVCIGVVGGSGGAGASTFAAALGVRAGRAGASLVVDLDQAGAGLDRFVGVTRSDDEKALWWEALAATVGRLSGRSLREAVPRAGPVGVLTWARGPDGVVGDDVAATAGEDRRVIPEVVREVMAAAARGHDTVVIDLPRHGVVAGALLDGARPLPAGGSSGSGDGMSAIVEVAARCDLMVVLVTPTLTGVASATRTVAALGRTPTAVVVRGRGIDDDEVARVLGAPVVAHIATRRRVVEAVELGVGGVQPRGDLARACDAVLALLGRGVRAAA